MLDQVLVPMEPVMQERPFDDPNYLYQLKWDGIRSLAFVDGNKLRLQTRKGYDHTTKFPELSSLPVSCRAHNCILDGELIVLKENKPSFELILKREQAQNPHRIQRYSLAIPAAYAVFDIVYLNDRPLDQLVLEQRQHLLKDVVVSDQYVFLVENFSSGTALYQAVCQNGLEGIVAKHRQSQYVFGKHPSWIKIKCWKEQLCVVGGLSYRHGRLKSVLLGAYQQNQLLYLGSASSGLTERDKDVLAGYARKHHQQQAPFVNPPAPGSRQLIWLPPRLTLVARYLELTSEGIMRSPHIIGFSTEAPENCRIGANTNDHPYY